MSAVLCTPFPSVSAQVTLLPGAEEMVLDVYRNKSSKGKLNRRLGKPRRSEMIPLLTRELVAASSTAIHKCYVQLYLRIKANGTDELAVFVCNSIIEIRHFIGKFLLSTSEGKDRFCSTHVPRCALFSN